MVNHANLERVQTILGYRFRNPELLVEALTAAHRIELEDGAFQSYENNRRLAKVGEAAIKLVLTGSWYESNETLSVWYPGVRHQ